MLTGRGGQSALQFARLRMDKRHNYVRKVAEAAVQLFITNDKPNISAWCWLVLQTSRRSSVSQTCLILLVFKGTFHRLPGSTLYLYTEKEKQYKIYPGNPLFSALIKVRNGVINLFIREENKVNLYFIFI
jgi:hypothetical protein